MIGKKKKRWTIHIKQTKSTVTFTHSPNKCHNIFTKHLFSVVVDHSFLFYYFILTYKKLIPQILWNLLCQYNNIYKRKKKVQTEDWKKKKNVATVATVPLGTVAIFKTKKKKKKDKVANKN